MYKNPQFDNYELLGRLDVTFNADSVNVLVKHFFGKFVDVCFVFQWTRPELKL